MQDLENAGNTCTAAGTKPVEKGTADQRATRAKRDGAQDVLAGADTTIHPDLGLVADGVDDGRQGGNGRGGAVKLPPAMVGDDDRVGPDIHRLLCVLSIENAFQDDLAVPHPADFGDILP